MRPLPSLLCILALPALAALPALPDAGHAAATRTAPRSAKVTAAAVEARVRRIEQGLLPANIVMGDPPQRMALLERMKVHGVPGVSIAVINNYRVEWAKGYGVRIPGSNEPVGTDTLFQAASISKPVTAVAALRLVEQGRLSLDEDVNRRLRSWRVPENEFTRVRKVTLRGILTHTAGFRVMFYPGTPTSQPIPSTLDLLEGRQGGPDGPIRVVREPGTEFEYSGAGFIVLQQLLEDVTRKPFVGLMDDLVFGRVGMRNSTFAQVHGPEMQARLAAGTERGKPVAGGWLLKPNMASGGIWTTASDIAAFAIELQKAVAGRRNRLLRPAMARLMMTPWEASQRPDARAIFGGKRGLGIEVGGEAATFHFSHGGDNEGYRSQMIALGDGRGVVILINGGAQGLIREIVRGVATEYGWPIPEYLPIQRTVASVQESVLRRYVGNYEWPEGHNPRTGPITIENGQLVVEGQPLRPESDTRFFTDGGATYTFVTDAAGKAEGFRFEVPGLTLVARKIED